MPLGQHHLEKIRKAAQSYKGIRAKACRCAQPSLTRRFRLFIKRFVEIVRTYAHAEDVPLYADLFARAIKNGSGPEQSPR